MTTSVTPVPSTLVTSPGRLGDLPQLSGDETSLGGPYLHKGQELSSDPVIPSPIDVGTPVSSPSGYGRSSVTELEVLTKDLFKRLPFLLWTLSSWTPFLFRDPSDSGNLSTHRSFVHTKGFTHIPSFSLYKRSG